MARFEVILAFDISKIWKGTGGSFAPVKCRGYTEHVSTAPDGLTAKYVKVTLKDLACLATSTL